MQLATLAVLALLAPPPADPGVERAKAAQRDQATAVQAAAPRNTGQVGAMLRADSPRDALTLAALVNERRFDELPQGFRAGGDPLSALKLIRSAENEGQRNWMARNPEHPRSKLDRYVIVHYETLEAAQAAAESLQREPTVQFAYASGGDESGSEPGGEPGGDPPIEGTPNRWHLDAVNAPAAWQLQTGWIPVGVMDSGLDTDHQKFLPYIGNAYNGGNWVRALSRDVANVGTGNDPTDVDEVEVGDTCTSPPRAGHGTHVAGLVAASDVGNQDAVGVCHDCTLIISKRSGCLTSPIPGELLAAAITHQIDMGSSVVNYSGALRPSEGGTIRFTSASCAVVTNNPECLALSYAEFQGVPVVASTGNFPNSSMGFPASDVRTVAVSGIEQNGGGLRNWLRIGPNRPTQGECPDMPMIGDPRPPSGAVLTRECGGSARWGGVLGVPAQQNPNAQTFVDRNYWPHDRAPEVVAPAFQVYSTFYENGVWVGLPPATPRPFWRTCMDTNDAANPNRYGFCTGTSMAAPIVAGVIGLIRSTNPLLSVGVRDELQPNGLFLGFAGGFGYSVVRKPPTALRKVLAQASSVPSSLVIPDPPYAPSSPPSQPSADDIYGSGIPNAQIAVEAVLGEVEQKPLVNRVAPAYYMYKTYFDEKLGTVVIGDLAVVSVPQQRWALEFNGYFNGYEQINVHNPLQPPIVAGTEAIIRGGFYVFTTASKPVLEWKGDMQPVFLIHRSPGIIGIQDLSWAVGQNDLNNRIANGWAYFGRQGYLAPLRSTFGSPSCGYDSNLTMVRRMCTSSDCAIVLDGDVAVMLAAGYGANNNENTPLGCAIKNLDSDFDQIPDGFESIVGMNPFMSDSDGDGCNDLIEYPYTAMQTSDPMVAGDCP